MAEAKRRIDMPYRCIYDNSLYEGDEDDLVYSDDFQAFIHCDHVRDFYLDDGMVDIDTYEEVGQ